jgi:hypothetical protein
MRKLLVHLPVATFSLLVIGVIFVPYVAHAAGADVIIKGFDWFYGGLGKALWGPLIFITSGILWLIGQLIDIAIIISLDSKFYAGPAITAGWGIIRDICNILFIFVLVFTGIKTILSLDTADTRRIVISVIIGAILINFSLFITKAAIDVSNIFTAWITQGIVNLSDGTGGVSNSAISVLKMSKLTEAQSGAGGMNVSAFATGFALVALNCVAIYVFFKVAFLMFGRVVALIFVLIMSPIGFVGHLVPKLETYAKDWRDELTKACLMAPMFLLMLYITLFLATKFDDMLGALKGQPTNELASGAFGLDNYALFVIVIMMLLKSLEVAEEYTGKVAGQIGGVIKGAAMLATGTMAMGTIGKGAHMLANNTGMQKWASSSAIGAGVLRTAQFTAKSKFGAGDAVKPLGIDKLPGPAGSAFKEATKGGYAGAVKAEVKETEEFAKTLGEGREGAENRQAYAGRIKDNLYAKVMSGAGAGLSGAVSGAAVGSLVGPGGTVIGGVLGAVAGVGTQFVDKNTAGKVGAVVGGATGAVGGAVVGSVAGPAGAVLTGTMGAGAGAGAGAAVATAMVTPNNANTKVAENIAKGADKELAKLNKTEVEKSLSAIGGGDSVEALEEKLIQINEQIAENTESIASSSNKVADELKSLQNKQNELTTRLASFKTESSGKMTVGGQFVSPQVFAERKASTESALKVTEEAMARATQSLKNDPDQRQVAERLYDLQKQKKEIETRAEIRKKKVAEQIAKLKKAGVSFTTKKKKDGVVVVEQIPENEAGMKQIRDAGKAVERADLEKNIGDILKKQEESSDSSPKEKPVEESGKKDETKK